MAFALQNFSRSTDSSNAGKSSGGEGGAAIFTYQSSTDDAATVAGADYFANLVHEVAIGDLLFVNASDAYTALRVVTLDRTAGTITTESVQGGGGASGSSGSHFGSLASLTDNYLTHPNSYDADSDTLVTDTTYYVPILVGLEETYTRIGTENVFTIATGNARLGIYGLNSEGLPGELVLDAGTFDVGTTGEKEIVISQSLLGKYYLAVNGSFTSVMQLGVNVLYINGNVLVSDIASEGGDTRGIAQLSVADATVSGSGFPATATAPTTKTKVTGFRLWLRKT